MMSTGPVSLKVIALGEYGVGKTSLFYQFVHDKFDNRFLSIRDDCVKKEVVVDGRIVILEIIDSSGGFDIYRSLLRLYCNEVDVCILVYDVTSPESFVKLEYWRDEFLRLGDPQVPKHFPFFVIGNKIDLEELRAVSARKAEEWCESKGNTEHFEISAKDNMIVKQVFLDIIRTVLRRKAIESDDGQQVVKIQADVKPNRTMCWS
ncbi:Rab7c1 [Monocercomonoides exilis]|uniref:Rab7c1 n=1 Tax=Monocercomonoides exilis TaxID=2049356 RepID=UPI00355A7937|nr:Rab7c1 [Monocercomonoides exilis]|eukprot:MONOS_10939.1-p1 / transcript=MONOS_10939.1 / gene=MONOS_10939 / organism=Monocercomonoides_exilis_PA203 / gene_product=Rab7c1 / transcript_product=Rab7c1 / location=Mono_scaffold00520:19185-19984(+) / protein_length=205 / sequence_SO=supercontig / SO=protein_coding / is_pseudo=false